MRTRVQKNESTTTQPPATAGDATQSQPEKEPEAANTTATENAQPSTPTSDELAAKVEEAEKQLDAVGAEKSFTKDEFAKYVDAQIELGKAEDVERRTKRFDALKAVIASTKASFDAGGSASVAVYVDPWAGAEPTVKTIESPTGVSTGTSNITYPVNVDTAKRALAMAKALREDNALAGAFEGDVIKRVAKSGAAALHVMKAGEAATALEKIASLFGITPDEDGNHCDVRWKVSDIIGSLVEAKRMEEAMSRIATFMGGGASAAAPTETEMAADAGTGETPTTKSNVSKAATDDGNEDDDGGVWPIDMNARRVSKEEEIRF